MAKVCDICGKGTSVGNRIVRHGLSKKSGGIGLHTTGINKRRFLPNLQRIRIKSGAGNITARVCTSCIKAGKINKA
jgi:large subunit ribosomal protein L28